MLGHTVRDRITGFQGVVTGRCEYLTGCNQVLVAPPAKDGAFVESQWLDEQRLVWVDGTDVITLDNGSTPGCDKQAPKR